MTPPLFLVKSCQCECTVYATCVECRALHQCLFCDIYTSTFTHISSFVFFCILWTVHMTCFHQHYIMHNNKYQHSGRKTIVNVSHTGLYEAQLWSHYVCSCYVFWSAQQTDCIGPVLLYPANTAMLPYSSCLAPIYLFLGKHARFF